MRCAMRARLVPTPLAVSLRCSSSSGANVLPAVDLAKRAAYPSQSYPATWSKDEPLNPTDPRVVWREHYSLEREKPYYQNIRTMKVTEEIPEGFISRFPRLYVTNGYRVDENGAVFRGDGETGSSLKERQPRGVKSLTLKQRMAAYGAGGLLWYLIIHNICLACVFTCLYVLRIDLIGMARSYGFDVKRSPEVQTNENKRPPFWKTFFVAIILNKMTVPVQLLVTVTTAPILVPRLEPFAAKIIPKMRAVARSLFARGAAPQTAAKA